jgi:hypothetical protein
LHRSPTGVTLTPAGTALYDEARALLEHAEHARARVTAAAGTATFIIGTLADSGEEAGTGLADAFRQHNPGFTSASGKRTSRTRPLGCEPGWSMPPSPGCRSTGPGSALACCARMSNKPVGLVSTAGGVQGLQAVNSMDFIARALRGWSVPLVLPVAQSGRSFDPDGNLTDEGVAGQLRKLGAEVVRAAR